MASAQRLDPANFTTRLRANLRHLRGLNAKDVFFLLLLGGLVLAGTGLGVVWLSYADKTLLREVGREASLRSANRLKEQIDFREVMETGLITAEKRQILDTATAIGPLYRYKIFNANGKVVLASRYGDVGTRYASPEIQSRIARGGSHVSIYLNASGASVGDYAEAYVPVMEGGKFYGAFAVCIDLRAYTTIHQNRFWISTIGLIALLLSSGAIAGYIIVRNVLEREENESKLRAAKEQADEASETKSRFLANMSHELRTPLNAILGFSEIMNEQAFGPVGNGRYQEYVTHIHESGHHLLDLINDLLDLSKVESGLEDLELSEIFVGDVVGPVITLLNERARDRELAIEVSIEEGLPPLWADGRKLKQILVNLLTNAVKFTVPGGKVTLSVRRAEDGGHVFRVTDTGIGISAHEIPKVLRPFYQAEASYSWKQEGTGLGLPLAKSLAEMHGGSLELASERGVGTTVTVRLPPPSGPIADELPVIHLPVRRTA